MTVIQDGEARHYQGDAEVENEEAEELMRKIEKEEERSTFTEPDKPCFHLCIVNLVIGTLYCAKVCPRVVRWV